MGCLECGDNEYVSKQFPNVNWLCPKCDEKWVKIGEQTEEELKNGKRVQVSRKKRSSN
ncbi:hypothetical protein [Microcystis phage MaeS]|nr:hypothetical protein [Microcystis phage MaeS]